MLALVIIGTAMALNSPTSNTALDTFIGILIGVFCNSLFALEVSLEDFAMAGMSAEPL